MDKTLHLLIMYTMLVLMVLLLQKGRNDKKSFYLAFYALIEVITNGIDSISLWGTTTIFDIFPSITFLAKPITLLWVPFFYFYVKSCFSSRFKLKPIHSLHIVPFGIAMLASIILNIIRGGETIAQNMFQLGSIEGYVLYAVDYAVRFQYIIYNILLIIQLRKIESENNKKENSPGLNVNIKWLRFIVYGYAIACSGAIATFILFHINMNIANKINIISILYFFLFFFIIFYDTIAPKALSTIIKNSKAVNNEDELIEIMNSMNQLMEENPLYLNADLSLKQIANKLKVKERSISQAINTIEKRHFKDYINQQRVEHASELLIKENDKAIFEIMYESGFNTKGPFNSAFKKYTGLTPSEYRNKANKDIKPV